MKTDWVLIDLETFSKEDKYKFQSERTRTEVLDRFVDDSSAFDIGGECFGKLVAHNIMDGCAAKLKRRTMILRSDKKGVMVVEGEDERFSRKNQFVQKVSLDKPKHYLVIGEKDAEKLKDKIRLNKALKNWDPKTHKTIPKGAPVTQKGFDKVKKCADEHRAKIKKIDELKSKMNISGKEGNILIMKDWPFYFKRLEKGYRIPGFLKKTTLEGAAKYGHIQSSDKFVKQSKNAKIELNQIKSVYAHPEYPLECIIKMKDSRLFSFDSQKQSPRLEFQDCGAGKLHEKCMKTRERNFKELEKNIKFESFDVSTVDGVSKDEYNKVMNFSKEFRRDT